MAWERINNCKYCGGYGYYSYFDGGGDAEIRKCEVCKAKPSKQKCTKPLIMVIN